MFQIEPAAAQDREELTRLYTVQKGRPFCFWTEEYPAPENLEDDLARRIVARVMQVLKERGCRGIHLLVNPRNLPALRVYRFFRFETVGECDMYGQHFL